MRRTDLSDRTMRIILAVLCTLVAAMIAALGVLIGTTIDNATQRAREQIAQTAINHLNDIATLTCRRQNVTRATDNQAHLESYQLYQFLLRASKATEAHEPAATQRAIGRLQAQQNAASWTPLINCTAPNAVTRSLSLQPVPFSQRHPPNTALDPLNAARPDPIGSVS